eukprot:824146-Amorphochlora_amoeboformis.AAC.1
MSSSGVRPRRYRRKKKGVPAAPKTQTRDSAAHVQANDWKTQANELRNAIKRDDYQKMQEMLNSKTVKMKGRRLLFQVQRPIFTAAEFGSVKVILQLICNGESPSTPGHGGRSPIMCAIQHDQPAAFKVLVEAGGRWGPPTSLNPDPAPPADQKGWTPLHYAAAYSAIKCLDLMLSGAVSANMDIKDNFMKE